MNFAKVTACILLSLSLLVIGFGYAQMSDEIFATGNLDYTYTELYICAYYVVNGKAYYISGGVSNLEKPTTISYNKIVNA